MQDVKMTDGGRTVYGGGGISPDEKYTTPKFNTFQRQLLTKFAFFNFSKHYFASHDIKLPQNWAPDQNVLNEFHAFLLQPDQGIQFTEAEFAENNDWVKRFLRKEMYIAAFSVDESRRISVETDPMVEKAVESLPKAKALLESTKKVIDRRLVRTPIQSEAQRAAK
jgi:carboxyl-terminal processing protease